MTVGVDAAQAANLTSGSSLPTRARIVVIGGGVGGASVAYHLAALGETDVVLVDRAELTSGSTFHSAGLVGQLRSDPTLTRMNVYSVELYRRLQAGEHPPGWVETGSIRLASSEERMQEIRRQVGWAESAGLPLTLLSADEAREMFPLMSTDGVVGAAYMPTDGQVDPSSLCMSLAAGARAMGVRIHQRTRVLGIDTVEAGRAGGRRVSRVRTDAGDIECDVVVDCGGMFAAEIARMVGVRVPIIPMSHQYLVTEAFLTKTIGPLDKQLPSLRDPDLLVYYRQEVDGLVMGGYERQSRAWTASATSFDAIPADFNGRLLPDEWDRFEEITENSTRRVPAMAEVGVRSFINGPEGFTPDNEFVLGESEVGGFFVAAGFCAHGIAGAGGIGKVVAEWVIAGEPSMDLHHMDIRRFGASYTSPSYSLARTVENYESYYDIRYPGQEREAGRPLRLPSAYSWHAGHSAVFGEKSGWERVNYYADHESAEFEGLRPRGWAGREWSTAVVTEARAVRSTGGLFDESSFAKIEVSGPDALSLLQWACAADVDKPVNAITYTQMLNSRGGIEADVTITRTAVDSFLIITGTAFGTHDREHLRRLARLRDAEVRIADVTAAWSWFGLWGPAVAPVLQSLCPIDISAEALPFMRSVVTTIGSVPVRLLRVTYVGEFGWEIACPSEYGAGLWALLAEAGASAGVVPAGYRAIESLRLEKGYRAWGSDIGPERTPLESGLGFAVAFDKAGGFQGRDALIAQRDNGIATSLRCLLIDDPRAVALGAEPVKVNGAVVSRVTTGGYGAAYDRAISYAYLPTGVDGQPGVNVGDVVEVGIFGEWFPATIVEKPTSAR